MLAFLAPLLASLVQAVLGFFLNKPQADPAVVAQAQRDRADALDKEVKDMKDAETIRDSVNSEPVDKLRDDPGNLYRD